MGCGVACVAYLTGASYEVARERFFGNIVGGDWCRCGYTRKALVQALDDASLKYEAHRFSKHRVWHDQMRDGDVLVARLPKGGRKAPRDGCLHYVVATPHGWMDPLDKGAEDLTFKTWTPSTQGQWHQNLMGWTEVSYLKAM